MSEDKKNFVRRWFEVVWNQKDEAAIDEMFGAQSKSHGFPDLDSVLVGPAEFKAVHRRFCGAFPDLKVTLDDVIAEGNVVAVRWHADATHLGDHLGISATGRKAKIVGSSFLTISGGQTIEGWNQMDMAGLIRRLQER